MKKLYIYQRLLIFLGIRKKVRINLDYSRRDEDMTLIDAWERPESEEMHQKRIDEYESVYNGDILSTVEMVPIKKVDAEIAIEKLSWWKRRKLRKILGK